MSTSRVTEALCPSSPPPRFRRRRNFPPPSLGPTLGRTGRGGTREDAEGQPTVWTVRLCTSCGIQQSTWGWSGTRQVTACKIAGIAYTGSNPVPATQALSCENATVCRPVRPDSMLRFPSTRRAADTVGIYLRAPRRRAEHAFDQPGHPGARSEGAGGCRPHLGARMNLSALAVLDTFGAAAPGAQVRLQVAGPFGGEAIATSPDGELLASAGDGRIWPHRGREPARQEGGRARLP
jgi:hypothetical protein